MKISLVTETFPPEINGVAMTLSHLVEGLAERGHQVTVHRPAQNREDRPRSDGVYRESLYTGFPIPGYAMLKVGLPARARLSRQWQADRPDIVHVATEGPLGYSALGAARGLSLPISSSFHTNFHEYGKHYGIPFLTRTALAYLRHFHNRALLTLSPTDELNQALARDGFRNLGLLARGVNTTAFAPRHRDPQLRATYGAGENDLLVVHVSRLAPEKNYPLLFKAFDALRATHPSARFVVVSDGPLRRRLTRRYPHVHFTGFLPRAELARHYASGDLFLYASLTETFGNVVTEAMASGLPVVAFNYAAANRYIRHGENGWLVSRGQAAPFVEAALHVAGDPNLRRRLGVAARLTAESITWTRVIDSLEDDLHRVAQIPLNGHASSHLSR